MSGLHLPTVVVLGTLDTKGREYGYVKECLVEADVTPLMIDFGVLADHGWPGLLLFLLILWLTWRSLSKTIRTT